MIIDRFGDTYEDAYPLPPANFTDDWAFTRPPVTARVGNMNGAVDFYGTEAYPLGPLVIRKKVTITGSSWLDVDTQLDDLIYATILREFESKLWGLQRDGTSTVWAYAKCTRLEFGDKSPNIETLLDVSLEFFCREGIWYGEGGTVDYETAGTKTLTNGGAGEAQVGFTFYNNSAGDITVVSAQHLGTGFDWTFNGVIPSGSILVVDSANQVCTLDGAAAYSGLTIGAGQTSWMTLTPGSNQITIAVTPGTGPFLYEFAWTETG